MGLLRDKLRNNEPVLTAEISPPKGPGIRKLKENIEQLKPWVTAINITDCQRSIVRMASWAACKVILEQGAEPVLQVTGRDRNSIAIQADLMGSFGLGIRNVLFLTGDPVKAGDSPHSKPVFELESLKLLELASQLGQGKDGSSLKMNSAARFFKGAVVNPSLAGSTSQLERMKKKVQAGASFFQTQANYDTQDFRNFLTESRPLKVPVLAGILILHSADIATYIHKNIPGIRLPQEIITRLETASDPVREGIQMAVESMRQLKDYCAGFHLMTIRQEHLIPQVIQEMKNG